MLIWVQVKRACHLRGFVSRLNYFKMKVIAHLNKACRRHNVRFLNDIEPKRKGTLVDDRIWILEYLHWS